jgi:hypothetical protein
VISLEFHWAPTATWQADRVQRHRDFIETVLPGSLKMCLLLWGWGCGFSTTELQHTMGKMSGSGWAQHCQEGELDMGCRLHGLLGHRMLTPMDSFLWEHLKKHVYPQRSTPTCYSVSDRMPCDPLPSTLKWTGAASNTYCNYEAPMILSFNNLRHLTVTCILKTIL